MKFDEAFSMFKRNKSGLIGGVIGALIAILVLIFGFLKVLFVAICAAVGCLAGSIMQSSKNWIRKLIDKIFPPGTYR